MSCTVLDIIISERKSEPIAFEELNFLRKLQFGKQFCWEFSVRFGPKNGSSEMVWRKCDFYYSISKLKSV